MVHELPESSLSRLLITRDIGRGSRVILWAVCSFTVVMMVWAGYAEVDELVRGDGKVIPSKQVQVVQNLEGGILSELYVSEGDLVKAGQVLLKIDDTLFESNYQKSQVSLVALRARVARLKAESMGHSSVVFDQDLSDSFSDILIEQRRLFEGRADQLRSTSQVLEQQKIQQEQFLAQALSDYQQAVAEKALAEKEFKILKPLFSQGVVSEVELLQSEKTLLRAEGEVSSLSFKKPQIEAAIAELEDKQSQLLIAFRSESQQELNLSLAELDVLRQGAGAIQDRVKRTQVRSPVNGTIKQIMVNTIGGVLKPGMDLVNIVPVEDSLLIETKIRPSDIARLYPGQRAVVKFTAYDFTVYGGLEAELRHISADSITDDQGESYYVVRVKTRLNNLGTQKQPLPIIPGMVAQVDILTGKKTLLDYLLKPILRAKQVALTEP